MLNYLEEQINFAIDAVHRGMPVATTAKCFSVPRITVMYRAKGKTHQYRQMGPDTILTKEAEKILVQWILARLWPDFP